MRDHCYGPIKLLALFLAMVLGWPGSIAFAQQTEFTLDPTGTWTKTQAPVEGSDEAVIAEAEEKVVQGSPGAALGMLNRWISRNKFSASPMLPTAYRLRGDAKYAAGNEYKALFDYETVARSFVASEEFVTVLEREMEIGSSYLRGKKRRWFGLRLFSAKRDGEQLLFQIAQRMPGSSMQEQSLLELGDYYFRQRELDMVTETYRVFLRNFPKSEHRDIAMRRQVDANAASYKGPAYDASGLREAKVLVEAFQQEYPNDVEQAGLNESRVARIDESLASEKLYTAKWYLSQNDTPSARLTLRRIVIQFPGTLSAQAAYEIMEDRGWSVGQSASPPVSVTPESDAARPLESLPQPAPPEPARDSSNATGESR